MFLPTSSKKKYLTKFKKKDEISRFTDIGRDAREERESILCLFNMHCI